MKPTILLVDIASHDRENQRMFLQSHGYEVFVAETEETAQQLCRQVQPDLVLLHDSPPHLAGPELCRRLKQEPLNQLTPVVLVSSSATPAEVLRGGEAGAASFWDTPCTLRDALGRIEAFLRLKNYIDEQAKAVVLTLALSVETRHSVADEHSGTLADYASRLGQNLGMTEEELEELRLGCLLHDIGNVAIPDRILLKPDRLNREETEIVRQHPATGERIGARLAGFGLGVEVFPNLPVQRFPSREGEVHAGLLLHLGEEKVESRSQKAPSASARGRDCSGLITNEVRDLLLFRSASILAGSSLRLSTFLTFFVPLFAFYVSGSVSAGPWV